MSIEEWTHTKLVIFVTIIFTLFVSIVAWFHIQSQVDPDPDRSWMHERLGAKDKCRAQVIVVGAYNKALCDHVDHHLTVEPLTTLTTLEQDNGELRPTMTAEHSWVATCTCSAQRKVEAAVKLQEQNSVSDGERMEGLLSKAQDVLYDLKGMKPVVKP